MSYFDDQDHMDFAGEFTFRVNETCLSSDHNIFRVAPTDRDAHNPILVHLKPSDMIWKAKRAYVPYEIKQRRREKRKATQKSNKRKGFGDGPSVDESWSNWDDTVVSMPKLCGTPEHVFLVKIVENEADVPASTRSRGSSLVREHADGCFRAMVSETTPKVGVDDTVFFLVLVSIM